MDEFIYSKRSVSGMTAMQRDNIFEVINLKSWYLMFFMYSPESGIPCVVPTLDFDSHLNSKETESDTSLPPIIPKQYRESGARSRGGRQREITGMVPE